MKVFYKNMAFFKRHKTENGKEFDLFGAYAFYIPGGIGMFWLIVMFMLGAILGNVHSCHALRVIGKPQAHNVRGWHRIGQQELRKIPGMVHGAHRVHCHYRDGVRNRHI